MSNTNPHGCDKCVFLGTYENYSAFFCRSAAHAVRDPGPPYILCSFGGGIYWLSVRQIDTLNFPGGLAIGRRARCYQWALAKVAIRGLCSVDTVDAGYL